ncbi:3'-5' exonuclease [Luteibacter yeojuensis]
MAKLIPARSTCLPRMTAGERRVSERLEEKLEDDYLLWYDVPIGLKYSKPDFVIFHPRRGLLVLEVKDWKIETIKAFDRTSFTLITDRGLVQASNPVAQARMYALEVSVVLERDPQLRHPPESKYAGKMLSPWAYGAVLTNITRKQFDAAGLGDVIPAHLAICQDEIVPSVDSEALQTRLWNMFPWQFSHALSLPQIDRVRWHLFPEVRVVPGEGQFGLFDNNTSSQSRIEIPDLIRVMDIQQEQLARSLGEGHRIIHGVAGSGKTMILGYRCVHLAKTLSKPILVLCFNKTLAARLQQLIGERGLSEKVQVYNFHSWCSSQIKAYNLVRPTGKGVFDKLVTTVVDGVDSGLVPSGQYGAILIDEGHDFEPDWYSLITKMVDPQTNSLLVLYDDAQNIYGKASRRKFTWRSVGVDAVGHTTILKLNYRNTLELLSVAKAFVDSSLEDGDADDEGVPLISPESAGRRGPIPELLRAGDRSDEAKITIARIREHLSNGRSPSDIAVITRHERDAEYFHAELAQGGVSCRLADEKGKAALFLGDPSVKVITMHSSKGLEFPIVLIPRIGDMPGKSDDPVREARLLYVAMTRATEEATVMHDKESEFSVRLTSAIETQRLGNQHAA